MARKTSLMPIELDNEVAALVQRVGTSGQPKNFMREYSVVRPNEGATWVTVTFLADDEFCRPPQEEVPGQQEIPIDEGGKE